MSPVHSPAPAVSDVRSVTVTFVKWVGDGHREAMCDDQALLIEDAKPAHVALLGAAPEY